VLSEDGITSNVLFQIALSSVEALISLSCTREAQLIISRLMKIRLMTNMTKEGSVDTQLAERIRFRKLIAMGLMKSKSYL